MALAEIIHAPERPSAQEALARWLGSLWPTTADTYRRALELVPLVVAGTRDLSAIAWERMDRATLARIREQLHARGYRPATVNRTLSAVREAMRVLARPEHGCVTREWAASVCEVENLRPSAGRGPGRMLETDEQRALMRACDRVRYAPKFHRALVALLLAGGLRKHEAARFLMSPDFADYSPETGAMLVHGKGRKERTVYFAGAARAALDDFVSDDDRGWRFRRLETSQIGFVLLRLRRLAGISHCTPHDLRRSFASGHLERGTDIVTVRDLMGHASVTTTANYDRRAQERLRAAAFDPWGE